MSRSCGECTLCCRVLRVDELAKLAGAPCPKLRAQPPGCGIHPIRPRICREYACLWLRGGLEEGDRPDRLGALLDVVSRGGVPELRVVEAEPGAHDRSPRLRAITRRYRESLPVRISDAGDALDPDRECRLLLPGDEEQRIRGEHVTVLRGGRPVAERRLAWLERWTRRAWLRWQRQRLKRYADPENARFR